MRIGNVTHINRLQASVQNLHVELAKAEEQISTGKVASVYSGLKGEKARVSVQLREVLTTRESYIDSINTTKLRAEVASKALTEIQNLATDLRVELIKQTQELYSENLPIMNEFSKTQIDRLANLLNSEVAGIFVFSGPASTTSPINEPTTIKTNFAPAVNTVLDAAGANTAGAVLANANTWFNDTSGTLDPDSFQTTINDPEVRVGHANHGLVVGDQITYSGATSIGGLDMNGTFTVSQVGNANTYHIAHTENADASVAAGGGTTIAYNASSWNKLGSIASTTENTIHAAVGLNVSYGEMANQEAFSNLFEVLNVFANISVSAGANETQKQANVAEYRTLVDTARGSVEQAFDDINRMVADLGGDIARLNSIKETHKNDIELITGQLDGVENIDSFEAINRFQSLRSQIESSYQITAASRGFSLINFLN